ncbi:DUF6950 family protein [Rhizobium rhizogenes]|uniref:DUF6950 domain-containing protein n=1 Tax=Rhizobium rhizogenes (strain K84 / ATCC BAA-868) TaxID=311403 RepID=B9JF43_RHIR8|nr:conserved hypothetical protein [Rhizobium rhizogenes K84]
MTLSEFVALPHRFRWGGQGGDDCLMFCATWVAEVTGIDPVAEYRGTYRTEEEAAAIIASAGGIVPLVDRMAARAGFQRTDDPQDGDIGVVVAPVGVAGDLKEIGAIRFGPIWLALGPAGVVGKKAEFVAAWRLTV